MTNDMRIFAPAAARNRIPIHECLSERIPASGTILEIASGSGEHAAYFAPLFPSLNWQPSNLDARQLQSTEAWRQFGSAGNFLKTLELDVTAKIWPVEEAEYGYTPITAIFNANMIHIAPWSVCRGLMAGAGRILKNGGMLFLYGPFKIDGQHTSTSNIQFETWLTDQNPDFGVRELEKVTEEARINGLELTESCPMPANNFIQVFKKQG